MNYAVLLSGGSGSRAGSDMPKQYKRVNGLMMVTGALATLAENDHIDRIVIAAAGEWHSEIIKDVKLAGIKEDKLMGFAGPGDTRQLSILNALTYIYDREGRNEASADADTVLVHDAARPYVSAQLITKCYEALPGYDGVMPVLPMKDTVYISGNGEVIEELIDRSTVYAGQAPELFKLGKYYDANLALMPDGIYKVNGASEPAVMAGMHIAMIPGDERNFKITTAGDLEKYMNENRV